MSDLSLENTSLHESRNESKARSSLLMIDFALSDPERIQVPQLLALHTFFLFL